MQYRKGDFTVVPNKEHLRGLNPITQTVFKWLCSYADDNGYCYPSRETLSDDCGINLKTLDKHLKLLVELRFLEIQARYNSNGGQTSNGYWILLKDTPYTPHAEFGHGTPMQNLDTPPSPRIGIQTLPILTQPIISSEEEIQPKIVSKTQTRINDLMSQAKNIKQTKEKKSPLFKNPPSTINRDAWFRWVSHSAQLSRLTDAAVRMQWERLATFSMQTQSDMIDYSISQNYRGLFEAKNDSKTSPKSIDLS